MIRTLLLCLTVFVGLSFATEDWTGTLLFNQILTKYKSQLLASNGVSLDGFLARLDEWNGTHVLPLALEVAKFSVVGFETLALTAPCEQAEDDINKIYCYAKMNNVKAIANVTIWTQNVFKVDPIILETSFGEAKLKFDFGKDANSYTELESVFPGRGSFSKKNVIIPTTVNDVGVKKNLDYIADCIAYEVVNYLNNGLRSHFNYVLRKTVKK